MFRNGLTARVFQGQNGIALSQAKLRPFQPDRMPGSAHFGAKFTKRLTAGKSSFHSILTGLVQVRYGAYPIEGHERSADRVLKASAVSQFLITGFMYLKGRQKKEGKT